MNQEPKRVLELMHRIQDVIDEFPDLSPPVVHFALVMLSSEFVVSAKKNLNKDVK